MHAAWGTAMCRATEWAFISRPCLLMHFKLLNPIDWLLKLAEIVFLSFMNSEAPRMVSIGRCRRERMPLSQQSISELI